MLLIKGRIPRPSPALAVALVALFVALSGTAVAATVVPLPTTASRPTTAPGSMVASSLMRAVE